jgi:hypothetical protein
MFVMRKILFAGYENSGMPRRGSCRRIDGAATIHARSISRTTKASLDLEAFVFDSASRNRPEILQNLASWIAVFPADRFGDGGKIRFENQGDAARGPSAWDSSAPNAASQCAWADADPLRGFSDGHNHWCKTPGLITETLRPHTNIGFYKTPSRKLAGKCFGGTLIALDLHSLCGLPNDGTVRVHDESALVVDIQPYMKLGV